MKLGIKTTGGVSKLKTKTTDGVVKAVECACCNPCEGPWGPGYDTQPNTVRVFERDLIRVGKCGWMIEQCYCQSGTQWDVGCGNYDETGCVAGDFRFSISGYGSYGGLAMQYAGEYGGFWIAGYGRTGGNLPSPYGVYSQKFYDIYGNAPQSITIAP